MKAGTVGDNRIIALRTVAVLAIVFGAACSIGFTLYAGHKNPSIILDAIFVIWVISPFMVLLLLNAVSKRWSFFARKTLYILMLFITFFSLAGYSGILEPKGVKTAFKFLIVPLLSWCIISICYLIAKKKNKLYRTNERT